MADSQPHPTVERPEISGQIRDVTVWHGAWAGSVLLALVAIAAGLRGMEWRPALALGVGALPGLAGLLLRRHDGRRERALLLVLWAACGTSACILAGGLSGPLAAWCLLPVAASAVFGGSSLLAEGAALALVATAVTALAGLAGVGPGEPATQAQFWLGFLAQGSTAFGLGAGLLLCHRRTLKKEATRRLAEAGLERLLTEQPHLLLALGSDNRIISAFGHAPQGIDARNLIGASLQQLAEPQDRPALVAAIASASAGWSTDVGLSPALAPDRTLGVTLCRGSDGRLIAILRDATAERAREDGLQRAREEAENQNAGKSRFLANMSHELRTPLNAIMGFSDVMRQKLFGELPGKYAEYAEMIHESGRHLLDLINDVLDISKIEAERYELDREEFDARDAINAALRLTRLQADDAGVSQRGLLPSIPLEVEADRRAIRQIVLNLVSNALKFTPSGGTVTVSASGHGEDLEIVVSDTGVGIAEADLERIGRPYEQAGDAAQKVRGTGLGLSLVRAFAELHGGEMSIESRLGEGTTVRVRMPVLRPAESFPAPPPPGIGAKVIAFAPKR